MARRHRADRRSSPADTAVHNAPRERWTRVTRTLARELFGRWIRVNPAKFSLLRLGVARSGWSPSEEPPPSAPFFAVSKLTIRSARRMVKEAVWPMEVLTRRDPLDLVGRPRPALLDEDDQTVCPRLTDELLVLLASPVLAQGPSGPDRWDKLGRGPSRVETDQPGVFVAGDIRSASTKLVAPAVSEWSIAVRFAAIKLVRSPPPGRGELSPVAKAPLDAYDASIRDQ